MKKFLLSAMLACAVAPGYAAPWMQNIPDATPMRRVSLPGAHDAAAKNISVIGKTQDIDLAAQWEAGVRAFDLRPKASLDIYHGSTPTGVSLQQAFEVLESKLAADNSDFAFVMVKNEGNEAEWAANMATFLQQHDANIVQFHPAMTLGQARGKIVVVTRDAIAGYTKAGYSGAWGDNNAWKEATMEGNGARETMRLQDHYNYGSNTSVKATDIVNMLLYSCGFNDESMWAVNFTSGYTGSLGSNSAITENAKASNKAAYDYLVDPRSERGRTGIIFMDYAGVEDGYYGQQLIDAIIARNYSPAQTASIARDRANWKNGEASVRLANLGYATGHTWDWGRNTPINANSVNAIESYRDDKFTTGTVMSFSSTLPNGTYVANIMAHANWTPGRNGVKIEACAAGAHGVAQLVVNDNEVSLPVYHNTSLPADRDFYQVPFTVTDGTVNIKIESLKKGANWFTMYVADIYKLEPGAVVYYQNFNGNAFGWKTTTGPKNNCVKWGGGDSPFATASYENWGGGAGKLYTRQHVVNGRYKVELDIKVNNLASTPSFFVNDIKTPITDVDAPHSYSTEIDVTNNMVEFGLLMETNGADWVLVDAPRMTLINAFEYNKAPIAAANAENVVEETDGVMPAFAVTKPTVAQGYTLPLNYALYDANNAAVAANVTEADGTVNVPVALAGHYTLATEAHPTVEFAAAKTVQPLTAKGNPQLGFAQAAVNAEVQAQYFVETEAPAATFKSLGCTAPVTYELTKDNTGAVIPCEVVENNGKLAISFTDATATYPNDTYTLRATSPAEGIFYPSKAALKLNTTYSATSGIESLEAAQDAKWYDVYGNEVAPENLGKGIYIRVTSKGAAKVIR